MYWNSILKSPEFVRLGAYLTHFQLKSDTPLVNPENNHNFQGW